MGTKMGICDMATLCVYIKHLILEENTDKMVMLFENLKLQPVLVINI